MNIKQIAKLIGAQYAGSYVSGHMGSRILRFRRNADKRMLVVKFAPGNDAGAIADIEANIRGYSQIRALGGSRLLPPELKEIPVTNGRALVMRDLGSSMRTANMGIGACTLLWEHFKQTIIQTITGAGMTGAKLPRFISEVTERIELFSFGSVPNLIRILRESDWTGERGKSAIMLLDFTPDNLFVHETGLSFIDPWNQGTYLGHPAISIGQFAALMRLYRMRSADQAARMLKERCVAEMPSMLGCGASSAERAFRVGSTLQFVLSAYVRRESDPPRAAQLLEQAHKLWR